MALAALTVLIEGGCVVVPWASPPGRISTSVTALRYRPVDPARELSPATLGGELRIGVHPLQAWPRFADRPLDVGVGFVGRLDDLTDGAGMLGGGYLELGLYPWSQRWGGGRMRLGWIGQADLYPAQPMDAALPAWGLGTGLLLEWNQLLVDGEPVEGSSEDGAFFGLGWGEIGFGLELGTSYQRGWDGDRWLLRAGLSMRLPALAGVAVVPLY